MQSSEHSSLSTALVLECSLLGTPAPGHRLPHVSACVCVCVRVRVRPAADTSPHRAKNDSTDHPETPRARWARRCHECTKPRPRTNQTQPIKPAKHANSSRTQHTQSTPLKAPTHHATRLRRGPPVIPQRHNAITSGQRDNQANIPA